MTVQLRVAELEARLAALEALPESAERGLAVEVVTALLDVYGAALERIVELAPEAISRFLDDELLQHLLLLHDLHPQPVAERVAAALDGVRPYLATHGGNVELLSIEAGVVRVRLAGTCHGCPASAATLQGAIEEAVYAAAPEVKRVEADGVSESPARTFFKVIPMESLVCPLPR